MGAVASDVLCAALSATNAQNGAHPVPGPIRISGVDGCGGGKEPWCTQHGIRFSSFGFSPASHEEQRPRRILLKGVRHDTMLTVKCIDLVLLMEMMIWKRLFSLMEALVAPTIQKAFVQRENHPILLE